MFKCKSRCLLKVISLIILQSFLFTSLSLAAPVEIFSLKARESTLSPTIQVGQPLFLHRFQNASNSDVSFTQKLLGERFVVVDPLLIVGVEDVQIVKTFSEAHAPVGPIESKVELMHAQNMAAVEVLKWVNNVGSKFAKSKADGAGARWTRHYYNQGIPWMQGTEVIGEGERDDEGMIAIDEEVGGGWEHIKKEVVVIEVDIAGDVVELTNGVNKKKILGTVSVATYSEKGATLNAPDIYITKWVVGPQAKGCGISAKQSVEENINKIATKLNKDVSQLAGVMLLRERHVGWLVKFLDAGIQMNVQEDKELAALVTAYREFQGLKRLYLEQPDGTDAKEGLLERLKIAKANLVKSYKALDKKVKAEGKYKIGNFYLLADGDLMPVWGMRMMGKGELDFVTGAGGSPEAVLTAGAVETLGGEMSARLCAYEVLKEAVKSDNPQDWPDVDEDWDKFTKEEESRLAGFGYDSAEKRGVVRSSNELIGGNDIVFIASAIKDSPWLENLKGVSFDENTGLFTVHVIRATKSGDKRIWKFRYKTGMPELREAISQESNPVNEAELHYKLSSIYGRTKAELLSRAIQEVEIALNTKGISEENRSKYQAAVYFYQGKQALLMAKDQEQKALDLFRQAYKVHHKDEVRARDLIVELAQFIGDDFTKQKNYEQAKKYYKIALKAFPEDKPLRKRIQETRDLIRKANQEEGSKNLKLYNPFPVEGFADIPAAGYQEAMTYLISKRDAAFTKAVGGPNTANLVEHPNAGEFKPLGGHILFKALQENGQAVIARNVLAYDEIEGHIREAWASNSVLLLESARSQFAGTAIDENKVMEYVKEIVERLGCDIPIVVHGDHVQYSGGLYDQKKILEQKYDAKHGKGAFAKEFIEKTADEQTIVHYEQVTDAEVLQAVQKQLKENAESERKVVEELNKRLIRAGFSSSATDASTIYDTIAGEIVENHYMEKGNAVEELVIDLERKGIFSLEFGVDFLKLDPQSSEGKARFEELSKEITTNMRKRGKTQADILEKMEELKLAFGALIRAARDNDIYENEMLKTYDRISYEIAQATIGGTISNKIEISETEKMLLLPTSNVEETIYQRKQIDEMLGKYAPDMVGKYGTEVEVGHVDATVMNPITRKIQAKMTHPMAVRVMADALEAAGVSVDLIAVNNGSGHGTDFDEKELKPVSQVGKISVYLSIEQQAEAVKIDASLAQHGTSGSDDFELYDLSKAGIIKFNIATIYQQIRMNVLSLLDEGLRGHELIQAVMVDTEALIAGLHVDARKKMMKFAIEIEEDPVKVTITGEESLFREVLKRIHAWGVGKKKLDDTSRREILGKLFAKESKRTMKIMDDTFYDIGHLSVPGARLEPKIKKYNLITNQPFVYPETAGYQEAMTYLISKRDAAFTKAVGGPNTANLVEHPNAGEFKPLGGHILFKALQENGQAVIARNVLAYDEIEGHIREAWASNSVLLLESARSQFAGTAIDENKVMEYVKEIVERLGCDIPIVVHGDHVQYSGGLYDQKKILEQKYDAKHGKGAFAKEFIEKTADEQTIVHYEQVTDAEVLQAVQKQLKENAESERKVVEELNKRLIRAGFSSSATDASTIYDTIAGEIVENHYMEKGNAVEELVIDLERKGIFSLEFGVDFLKLDPQSSEGKARFEELSKEITTNMRKRGKTQADILEKMEELKLAFGALIRAARDNDIYENEMLKTYDRISYEIAQATIGGTISNKIEISETEKMLLLPTSNVEETIYQRKQIDEMLGKYAPDMVGKYGTEVEVGHVDATVMNPITRKIQAKMTHPMAVRVMADALEAAGVSVDLIAVNNGSGHGTDFDEKELKPVSQVGKISVYLSIEQQAEAVKIDASLAQHGTSGSDDFELYDLSKAGIIKFNIATIYQQIRMNVLSLLDEGLRGHELIQAVMVDTEALIAGLHVDARKKMMKFAIEIEEDPVKVTITGEESLFREVLKRIHAWGVGKKKLDDTSRREILGKLFAKESKRTMKIMDDKLYAIGSPEAPITESYIRDNFGTSAPFSVSQFAQMRGIEKKALELLETFWRENDNVDHVNLDNVEQGYYYNPMSEAIQLSANTNPEDIPVGVPMRVIVGHSAVMERDMTIEQKKAQLDEFLAAGYKVIYPFGDFPLEYKGIDYLESGQRKFAMTYSAIAAQARKLGPNDQEFYDLMNDVREVQDTQSLEELQTNYAEYYAVLESVLNAGFKKMLSDAVEDTKKNPNWSRSIINIADLIHRQYPEDGQRIINGLFEADYYVEVSELDRDLKGKEKSAELDALKSQIIDFILNDKKLVKELIIREVSTIHELNSQIKSLFKGVSVQQVIQQIKLSYEPVEGIKDVTISDELQILRKAKIILEMTEIAISESTTEDQALEVAVSLGFNQLEAIDGSNLEEKLDTLRSLYMLKLASMIIYGGGANADNFAEVMKIWGNAGAFIGRAILKKDQAVLIAAAAAKSSGRPDVIMNFKGERDGSLKEWMNALVEAGIDLNAVKITWGVLLHDAVLVTRELQGKDVSNLLEDHSQAGLGLIIDARTAEVGIEPIGPCSGNMPANFLRKLGVKTVIIDGTKQVSDRFSQIENLEKEGIGVVILDNYNVVTVDKKGIKRFMNSVITPIGDLRTAATAISVERRMKRPPLDNDKQPAAFLERAI